MRVLVVGAGAVGGTVAARLAQAEVAVQILDVDADHVRLLSSPGLRLSGVRGEATIPLSAFTPARWLESGEPAPDIVLLAVRSQATEAALQPLLSRLEANAQVVSLQNGINEERIAALVGAERTVGCVVGFGATYVAPGHIEQTSEGRLIIGRLGGESDGSLEEIAALLSKAFLTRISGNILGELWSKMLMNSVTVLGALAGLLTGELLAPEPNKRVVLAVLREGIAVAQAAGVQLAKLEGALDPLLFTRQDDEGVQAAFRVLDAIGAAFGRVKSVTWRDFELGRPTEVDFVTGEFVRRGQALGVPVPINTAAHRMLKEIEGGTHSIGSDNLTPLLALAPAGEGVSR
jgi:2-dehydropantoate 2-reductase